MRVKLRSCLRLPVRRDLEDPQALCQSSSEGPSAHCQPLQAPARHRPDRRRLKPATDGRPPAWQ